MDTTDSTPLRRLAATEDHGCRLLSDPGIPYLDGSEKQLLELMRDSDDLSTSSDELAAKASTWPERYHLSLDRANLLRPLDLRPTDTVLEIGAGCGAITRYLGERCGTVDALEPVPERAWVARERTRDLPGVEVFVGDIGDVPDGAVYDIVAVVGVLEYTASGRADPGPYLHFLRRAASLLAADGTLVVAIENRLGVKYLAGAPEDHSGRPFDSLEGYLHGTPARTFSRAELTALLAEAGLGSKVLGAFPDYKLTRLVYSDELLEKAPSLAHRIPTFPSPDWSGGPPRTADEAAVWRTLVEAGLGGETPNSFVVLAGSRDPGGRWPAHLLAAYYAVGRKAAFASETKVVGEGGGVTFERRPVREPGPSAPPATEPPPDGTVELVTPGATFVAGEDLVTRLARCDDVEFARWIGQWAALVAEEVGDHQPAPVDLLPHNLVVTSDGQLRQVDSKFVEWGVDVGDVLARGALITGQRLSLTALPDRWGAFTIGGLVRHIGVLAGLSADGSWLPGAVAREAAFQAAVALNAPEPDDHALVLAGFEAQLQGLLRLPLVRESSTHLPNRGVDAVERELGRLGGAYQTLVDSQRDLSAAHAGLIESRNREVAALTAQLAQVQAERERDRELLARSQADVEHLRRSSSWKLTAPLRVLSRALRKPS
jgi:hypothetical protein